MNEMNAARRALAALQEAGADKAQCVTMFNKVNELTAQFGQISLLRTFDQVSLGLKAFVGGRTGSISIGSLEERDIVKAAKECVASAKAAKEDPAEGMNESGEKQEFVTGSPEPDLEGMLDRTSEFLQAVKQEFPKDSVREQVVRHDNRKLIYCNTAGTELVHHSGDYHSSVTFSATEGDKVTSFNFCSVAFDDLKRPLMDMGMHRALLAQAQDQLDTRPAGGKMVGTMIATPACLGSFLDALLGSFLSSQAMLSGASRWQNALGDQVADKRLSIKAAPLDSRLCGGERFTYDGFVSQDQELITDGVLRGMLLNLYAANKTGKPRARNQGGSLIVAPGQDELEAMIASVENGILINRFSGGRPGPSGDFSGIAKNSFIIKNGKIDHAACETMVSGNLAEMLNNIRHISRDTVNNGSQILPWISFDGITIR